MKRFRPFPGIIFALLGANMFVVGLTMYKANADRSFAVEPDYDQKAMHWDQAAREQARAQELGWTIAVDPGAVGAAGRHTSVTIKDRDGQPIAGAQVRLTAFASARARERFERELTELSAGSYAADMPIVRPGRWEFRLRITRGTDICAESIALDIPGRSEAGVP